MLWIEFTHTCEVFRSPWFRGGRCLCGTCGKSIVVVGRISRAVGVVFGTPYSSE